MAGPGEYDSKPHCSFCGCREGDGAPKVKTLVAGPHVFICDVCVKLCQEIIDERLATKVK